MTGDREIEVEGSRIQYGIRLPSGKVFVVDDADLEHVRASLSPGEALLRRRVITQWTSWEKV